MRNRAIVEWLGLYGRDWVDGKDLEPHFKLDIRAYVNNGFVESDVTEAVDGLVGGWSAYRFRLREFALLKFEKTQDTEE